ncbi:MAG: diacylglycerol/lipid kinase family protein [Candidatus Hodarchaeales archaeon]|jgi:YegS/Rv2252/BmrU family lipid kinase
MKKFFLIINPTAAGGRVENIWNDQIKPLIDEFGLDHDFEFTSYPGHAIEIARTRVNEGYQIICAIGGDGTSNEVLNGILEAEKQGIFAAIPVGTGNDIPSSFGIPEGDVEAAFNCLVKGQDKSFDVGYCKNGDRYFAGVASMGFDAEVADRTNKGSKRFSGTRNYQIALLKTILKFKAYNLVITADDEPPVEGPRMLLAIGNGKRYGAGMHICPSADVTDGKFSLTTLTKMSRFTFLRVFPSVYTGKHITNKRVLTLEGTEIHVDSPNKKCLYQADGEMIGILPETFVTIPNGLVARVPDPWISYSELWKKKMQ